MTTIFKNISNQVAKLFRTEEVEVTFKIVNNKVCYTFTRTGR